MLFDKLFLNNLSKIVSQNVLSLDDILQIDSSESQSNLLKISSKISWGKVSKRLLSSINIWRYFRIRIIRSLLTFGKANKLTKSQQTIFN